MPLISDDDRERIDLPAPGEWVEVKRRLSRGDRLRVQQAAYRSQRLGQPQGDPLMVDLLEAAEFALLDLVIKTWSFDVPVTPEAIRKLADEDVDAIKARCNVLYTPRTEEEKNG